ncbi:hypothetical protein CAPTEDRAFT_149512 [Capitella teleta]|uniref:Solute carrier family 66 member 3 n=1 Tax=Capitella teleta TaxID=283909 RepID=R7UNC0_CAPTE|nr:hypothetical protein CAPTEDRAFT_149512 [Capitella teleta]|eukprot:ELU07553.1 hypothetical protein CAPTEDRAFT_149512 [Capitella teleta]
MADPMNATESAVPFYLAPLFTEECYQKIVVDVDISQVECMQVLASKVVSYFIIAFTSVFIKVPQIVKILRAGSADGINFTSQLLVLITSTTNIAYCLALEYPISVWGESIALSLQILLIVLLILWYRGSKAGLVAMTLAYVISSYLLVSPDVPIWLHQYMRAAAIPMSVSSKILQILSNYRASSTGQLSAMTILLQSWRALGRVYSHVVETGDLLLIPLYSSAAILSGIMAIQIFYYGWKNKAKKSR